VFSKYFDPAKKRTPENKSISGIDDEDEIKPESRRDLNKGMTAQITEIGNEDEWEKEAEEDLKSTYQAAVSERLEEEEDDKDEQELEFSSDVSDGALTGPDNSGRTIQGNDEDDDQTGFLATQLVTEVKEESLSAEEGLSEEENPSEDEILSSQLNSSPLRDRKGKRKRATAKSGVTDSQAEGSDVESDDDRRSLNKSKRARKISTAKHATEEANGGIRATVSMPNLSSSAAKSMMLKQVENPRSKLFTSKSDMIDSMKPKREDQAVVNDPEMIGDQDKGAPSTTEQVTPDSKSIIKQLEDPRNKNGFISRMQRYRHPSVSIDVQISSF
jgi:hypothetical protein